MVLVTVIHLLTTLTLNHAFTISFQAHNAPFPQKYSPLSLLAPTTLHSRIKLDLTFSAQRFSF